MPIATMTVRCLDAAARAEHSRPAIFLSMEPHPPDRGPGRIIVLNGASSSGKSMLAKAMQQALLNRPTRVIFRCSGPAWTTGRDKPEVVNCPERGRTPVQESTDLWESGGEIPPGHPTRYVAGNLQSYLAEI